jgi:hypothetical protein
MSGLTDEEKNELQLSGLAGLYFFFVLPIVYFYEYFVVDLINFIAKKRGSEFRLVLQGPLVMEDYFGPSKVRKKIHKFVFMTGVIVVILFLGLGLIEGEIRSVEDFVLGMYGGVIFAGISGAKIMMVTPDREDF